MCGRERSAVLRRVVAECGGGGRGRARAVRVGDALQLHDRVPVGGGVDDDEAEQDMLLGGAAHPRRRVAPRGRAPAVGDNDAELRGAVVRGDGCGRGEGGRGL